MKTVESQCSLKLERRGSVSIVILRTGDAIPEVAARRGEFAGWIRDCVGPIWQGAWAEVDARTTEEFPEISTVSAFIITGSSCSVTERAPWMLRTEDYIRRIHALRKPLLGICFGHQLIGQALGGHVERNPRGREIGTVVVRQRVGQPESNPDELLFRMLFEGLADEFHVNATHVDSVVRLPEGAVLLAHTHLEPHAAFALGERTLGVQFHPEIDGDIMASYVRARTHLMEKEGLDAQGILERVRSAPDGVRILRNFVKNFVLGPQGVQAA
jgi:GMP synthase (glutamine-hydrolysing)